MQEGCGTNVSEKHSTSLFRFHVNGVRTIWHTDRIVVTQSFGLGIGLSAVSRSIRENEHGTVKRTFQNDHCGREEIVRKLPLYGPLHRLKKKKNACINV